MTYEIVRLPYDGAVDADGHVLEPITLWEEYLEREYRDRAIKIETDDEGFEYLEIAGVPSERVVKGVLGTLGAMGDKEVRPSPERRYMENIPFGAADPQERVQLMDQENLEKALLYPTLGLMWEAECTDPELSLAYMRAYNRWIADFCRDSGGRLVPIAHLTLQDPEGSAAELERAVRDGCKGAFVAPYTHDHVPLGHQQHDALWAKAQELEVPVGLHVVGNEPPEIRPMRFSREGMSPEEQALAGWDYVVIGTRQGSQLALLTFFSHGTLERFPELKLGVLEVGAGWIGTFLDRMDTVFETTYGRHVQLSEKPSTYFKRQCFISGDPDERAAAYVIPYVGADKFLWASDYPHPDHPASWVNDLVEFVKPLDPATRDRVLGGNAKEIYGLV